MSTASFSDIAQALGFTVVHSLWQITVIWLLFKAASWRLQHRNNAMYLLALVAMLLSGVWTVQTFSTVIREVTSDREVRELIKTEGFEAAPGPVAHAVESSAPTGADYPALAWQWLENHTAPVGWVWLCCASVLWLRLLGGWWMAQRLKRQGISLPGAAFQETCDDWARRLNILQKVRLLESSRVAEPLTLGFWKPVILFPIGMLNQLSPAQVEVLLLHELAHIRRHDYLINLFQLAAEVCFFYHPLFWQISREMRTRREYCCDDEVLRLTANPLLYAKTLTDLQVSNFHSSNQFVMNATEKSPFTERILRIAGIAPERSLRSNWLAFLLLPLFLALASWGPEEKVLTDNDLTFSLLEPAKRPGITTVPVFSTEPPAAVEDSSPASVDSLAPGAPYVVAAAPLRMNVFYIGVDNPLRIAASDIPASQLSPRLVGAGTITGSNGEYTVLVTQPGEVFIRIYRLQGGKETLLSEQQYRVKRIPDPTPKLGGKFTSRNISFKTLMEMSGIEAVLENFLFDAYCEVTGYELTVLPKKGDPLTLNMGSGLFTPQALQLMGTLDTLGGAVFMDDIKVKCPGDAAPRNVGGLAYKIGAAE